MTTSLLERPVRTATVPAGTPCQAFRGSLVAPCPNTASRTARRHGSTRAVCPAHAS